MREADVNTKVCGYDIPKGARIRISLIQSTLTAIGFTRSLRVT